MVQAGAVAVTDDGNSVPDTQLLRRALEYAKMFDVTVIEHSEDKSLMADGVMNEGALATRLGHKGIPAPSGIHCRRPEHRVGGSHGGPSPFDAHIHAGDRGPRSPGEEKRVSGHGRLHAAPFHLNRRSRGSVRDQRQDEPPAPHRGRSPCLNRRVGMGPLTPSRPTTRPIPARRRNRNFPPHRSASWGWKRFSL
jgi:hypothetical protein